jgi:hypothetical protein
MVRHHVPPMQRIQDICGISAAFRDHVHAITDCLYGRKWDIYFPVAASNLPPGDADSDPNAALPPSWKKAGEYRKSPRFDFAGFFLSPQRGAAGGGSVTIVARGGGASEDAAGAGVFSASPERLAERVCWPLFCEMELPV